MAHRVFKDAFISIATVDLSDHVKEVSLEYSAEMVDETTMGDNTRNMMGGLKDWRITAQFAQDYAVGEVDATLFAIVGTQVAVEVRGSQAAVSSTNPKYTGTALVESYVPAGGGVGDLQVSQVVLSAASDLVRATA